MADETLRHRFVVAPRSLAGEPAPEGIGDVCERLGPFPRCCDGCKRQSGYGCARRPGVKHPASAARRAADADLSESGSGIDETEESAAAKLAAIRDGLSRGLSPEQIAASRPEPGMSASTVYRWVEAGYDGLTNLDPRRKVRCRRRKGAKKGAGGHSARRGLPAFEALSADMRDAAWGMDAVEGPSGDSACLPTLLHRPTSFQLAPLTPSQDSASTVRTPRSVASALGGDGMRRMFGTAVADDGSEFADGDGVAAALGERPGETRLLYRDPGRADQKGPCEKSHVEIRKMPPKGRGVSFDRLKGADCAPLMSHVNSEPRGRLGFMAPAWMLAAVFGDDAAALMDAFGVEDAPAGLLDLTPECIGRARAERGDGPPAD